jgi:hypothetical protein
MAKLYEGPGRTKGTITRFRDVNMNIVMKPLEGEDKEKYLKYRTKTQAC